MALTRKPSPPMTAERRRNLPAKKMGLAGEDKYPVDTPGRAVAAKGRAKTALRKGRISKAQYGTIVGKANSVLNKGE